MGEYGRERVLKFFTWAKVVEQTEAIYREVIENSRRG